jgi:hypothetical protein
MLCAAINGLHLSEATTPDLTGTVKAEGISFQWMDKKR